MVSAILLSAIVGASASLLVVVSFNVVQKMRMKESSGLRFPKEEQVWE